MKKGQASSLSLLHVGMYRPQVKIIEEVKSEAGPRGNRIAQSGIGIGILAGTVGC